MLHGHGDDGYNLAVPLKADFSTNVWYGGAPDGLKEHLFEGWDKVQRYPEVLAESLTDKIARSYGLSSEHLLVTNGSTESIYLVAQALGAGQSAIMVPAFAEYEDACRMFGHQLHFISSQDLQAGVLPKVDMIYICNPNNPTGEIIRNLEQLILDNSKIIFIIDEAFIEFTLSFSSVINLVHNCSNLVVLRSMTKLYAIPGLRLAYLAAQPELIKKIKAFKLPWTVNSLAIESGHFIFDRLDLLNIPLQQILDEKAKLMFALQELGFTVHPSHTHFFLAETPIFNAAKLKEFLIKEHQLLIRDAANFRGLTDKYFRIATLNSAKNALLINALSEWINLSS